MTLSADQRAMLQLLLERDQGYEDIASLLGIGTEAVRRRARAALEELAGEDPDRTVGLTDYLLGQADPIGRADVVRHLQRDPDALRLAESLTAKLRVIAPEAVLPDLSAGDGRSRRERWPRPRVPLPRPRRAARARAQAASPFPATAPTGAFEVEQPSRGWIRSLSQRQSRVLVALAASAVLLIAVVLAVAGVFEGGGETATEPEAVNPDVNEEITRVNLRSQGGSAGRGLAVFGLATGDQPFLDLTLRDLEPAPEGMTHVLWFLVTDERGYPLAPVTVDEQGNLTDRFAIPRPAIPVAARTQFVDISLVQNEELAQDIEDALREEQVLVPYPGESVLRGKIPRTSESGTEQ